MPPPGPLPSICFRCQVRNFHRPRSYLLPLTGSFTPTRHYASARTHNPPDLIILQPPAPRPATRLKPTSLDDLRLGDLSKSLLTYEREAVLDATQMDISLLRPPITRVSEARYGQLYDILYRAFNVNQLRVYYVGSLTGGAVVPTLRKNAPKKDVVHAVLRDTWGIVVAKEIREREDVEIVREFSSNRRNISFLIHKDGEILRKWANKFSARISVNVQQSTLNVQASQDSIEKIEKQMDSTLGRIIQEDFDLSAVSRIGVISESSIAPIARMTNTFIEKADDATLRIFALGPEKHKIDDARRLLFTSLGLQLRTSRTLLGPSTGEGSKDGAFYPVSEDSSLPWMFRGKPWARWRNVKTRIFGSSTDQNPMADVTDVPVITKRSENVHIVLDGMSRSLLGDGPKTLSTEYEAILGFLLHDPTSHCQNQSRFVSNVDNECSQHGRIFCSTFPGLTHLTHGLKPLQAIRRRQTTAEAPETNDTRTFLPDLLPGDTESFLLRLLPSPWSSPSAFERYPPLEMTLRVNPLSGEPHSPQIEAVLSEALVDVMLPDQACDVRYRRRSTAPLSLGGEQMVSGVCDQEITRFLAESNLNPSKDLRLRASPVLQVSIPRWMIAPSSTDATVGESTQYLLTGLEYRRKVDFDWQGLTLRHTTIEGGISGGRTTEVKVLCRPCASSVDGPLPQLEQAAVTGEVFDTFVENTNLAISSVREFLGKIQKKE